MPDYRPTYPPGFQPRETHPVYLGPPLKPSLFTAPAPAPVYAAGPGEMGGDGKGPRHIALAPAVGPSSEPAGTALQGRAPETGGRPGTMTHAILRAVRQAQGPVDGPWLERLVGPNFHPSTARLVKTGHLKRRAYLRPERRRPVYEYLPVARRWPALPADWVLVEGDDGRTQG